MTPAVSVVMAVHDATLPYLAEALRSLRAQTFDDFETVLVGDGVTADRLAAVSERVGAVEFRRGDDGNETRGLTAALLVGLAQSRAPLIARMDADDVCRPERLARQVAAFEHDPHLGLCGTWTMEMDAEGHALRQLAPPCGDAALRRLLIRRNPFVHSSVMFRRDVYEQAGGYDAGFTVGQDYDLWLRMAQHAHLGCVNRVLLLRRIWPGQVSTVRRRAQRLAAIRARWRAVRRGQYSPWALRYCLPTLIRCALP